MVEVAADSIDHAIDEIVSAATSGAHPADVQDDYARISERIARSSYSLVCRELFQRVAHEPELFDTDGIDRALQTFQSSIGTTGLAVARGFEAYVNECVRQWLRDILRQSLKELRTNRPIDTSTDEGNFGTLNTPEGPIATLPLPVAETGQSLEHDLSVKDTGARGQSGETARLAVVDLGLPGAVGAVGRDAGDGIVYEGNVRVRVRKAGGVKNTLRFLNKLRAHPYLRVFNMTGDGDDVIISLALRQQTRLEQVLTRMETVTSVIAHSADEKDLSENELEVTLKGTPALHQVA